MSVYIRLIIASIPQTRYDIFDSYYYQTKIGKPKDNIDRKQQIELIKKIIENVIIYKFF